jgi:hypothetical protein
VGRKGLVGEGVKQWRRGDGCEGGRLDLVEGDRLVYLLGLAGFQRVFELQNLLILLVDGPYKRIHLPLMLVFQLN